jgi:hypothetical protein
MFHHFYDCFEFGGVHLGGKRCLGSENIVWNESVGI